jgi:hypothetical protein
MHRFAVALLLLTPMFAVAAPSVTPLVNSSTINYSLSPNQITIIGTSFSPTGVAPTVLFNNINVAPLVSSSNSQIVAQLPSATVPGTYRLRITNSQGNSYEFDVTYGAVGPQGPIGPQGLTGAAGAQGPPGPTGDRSARACWCSWATRTCRCDRSNWTRGAARTGGIELAWTLGRFSQLCSRGWCVLRRVIFYRQSC